jgi:hypothetical protein
MVVVVAMHVASLARAGFKETTPGKSPQGLEAAEPRRQKTDSAEARAHFVEEDCGNGLAPLSQSN